MHVGVVLGDIEPQAGGGFTFVHDVVTAFLDLASTSSHKFTLFAPKAYVESVRDVSFAANVTVIEARSDRLLDQLVSRLRHYLPISGFVLRRRSRFERQMQALGIDLVWLAGGMHDTYEIPYVTTVWDVQHLTHPWFPEVSANWRWDHRDLFFKRHFRRSTGIIVGTRVGKDEIIQYYGVPEDRLTILPHPTPRFALQAAADKRACLPDLPDQYVLYPAQFWPHKNHVNLLRAFKCLLQVRPEVGLVLVGADKGNRAFIEDCATQLGISASIRFMGFVKTNDLVALYQHAQALVYPSFSGPENLPPLEAFALGCPAIVSNYRGAQEQLGDAAILFDPTDPEDIADAMMRVLSDESLRSELVRRGRARAAKWTSREFVAGAFRVFDHFEAQRRCWPPTSSGAPGVGAF